MCKNPLLSAVLLSDLTSPVCLSLFPLVLPLRCVINQEFTVKAQEKPNDVFSSGKYLVPPGSQRLPQEPGASLSCGS